MEILILAIFIGVYVYEYDYCKKKNLTYTYLIIALFIMIFQAMAVIGNINIAYERTTYYYNYFLSFMGSLFYYIGYFLFGIIAISLAYIPIYKYKRNITQTGIINHYINILKDKNTTCTRLDYWSLFIIMTVILIISLILVRLLEIASNEDLSKLSILICILIGVLDLIFQYKRLEDADISRYFLLIRLLAFIGLPFAFVSYIVMLAILCIPSQQVPTTDLSKENK